MNTTGENGDFTFRRVSDILVYVHVYRIYRYTNFMNKVAVSFGNFHHQAVLSLNKVLVYGGIMDWIGLIDLIDWLVGLIGLIGLI